MDAWAISPSRLAYEAVHFSLVLNDFGQERCPSFVLVPFLSFFLNNVVARRVVNHCLVHAR